MICTFADFPDFLAAPITAEAISIEETETSISKSMHSCQLSLGEPNQVKILPLSPDFRKCIASSNSAVPNQVAPPCLAALATGINP